MCKYYVSTAQHRTGVTAGHNVIRSTASTAGAYLPYKIATLTPNNPFCIFRSKATTSPCTIHPALLYAFLQTTPILLTISAIRSRRKLAHRPCHDSRTHSQAYHLETSEKQLQSFEQSWSSADVCTIHNNSRFAYRCPPPHRLAGYSLEWGSLAGTQLVNDLVQDSPMQAQ